MGQTPDATPGGPAHRKEEPEAALEADIPNESTVQDDMTIERDDLPRKPERE